MTDGLETMRAELRTDKPTPGRVYDNYLGGKDNFAVDRSREQIARFLDGLEIVAPGLVQPQGWRPDPQDPPVGPLSVWCAVARKPLSAVR